ncbi:hypothetical protein HWV62_36725 [Athelia sp. TMB]|nr:hypothetical protein HWV62_36725 [Athelia sp. TMB]
MLLPLVFTPLAAILFSPVHASIDSLRENGENVGETKLYSNLIYVHAIFMVITFIFLIPLATFASRFGRNLMGSRWFIAHSTLNTIAVTTFFPIAWGVGWAAASPGNLKTAHHKIGVAIFALLYFQALGGITISILHRRQRGPRTKRAFLDHFHMWFGRIVLLLAWAQLWYGLIFFGSPLVCYVLLAIAQGLILLAYIVLEIGMNLKSPISHRGADEDSEKSTARVI